MKIPCQKKGLGRLGEDSLPKGSALAKALPQPSFLRRRQGQLATGRRESKAAEKLGLCCKKTSLQTKQTLGKREKQSKALAKQTLGKREEERDSIFWTTNLP